ncbi:MAG: NAD(P)H-dependent oxidoreductase [Myxococcales bacterium]|nr:NAD(P)H-dependent oxidoreductase [Myxococcales bacterium]
MKHLLIVYHSQSGNTEALAHAAAEGAAREAEAVQTRLLRAVEAGLEDLRWAHGLLLGTPENFGFMSGMMKDFFDRTYYPARGRIAALPYALFVSAGNDGSGAVREIERIARGYPFKKIAEPLIAKSGVTEEMRDREPEGFRLAVTEAQLEAARELGHTMAAGLGFGIF